MDLVAEKKSMEEEDHIDGLLQKVTFRDPVLKLYHISGNAELV